MATAHARVTVGTQATALQKSEPAGHSGRQSLVVQNTGAATVYLGDATVTTSTYGYALAAGAAVSLDLGRDDVLYGVVASSTVTVSVLYLGA